MELPKPTSSPYIEDPVRAGDLRELLAQLPADAPVNIDFYVGMPAFPVRQAYITPTPGGPEVTLSIEPSWRT